VERLIPYWQGAGYQVDLESDRPWLEKLSTLIGPSLTRLADAEKESRLIMTEVIEFQADAIQQLQQPNAKDVLSSILAVIDTVETLTEENAKEQINQITKALGVKKGVVMKSLRAGLMGALQGPDLIQSWVLLNQKGWDKTRLNQALTL
jgi:glutamyl-tRNA synthetase